MNEIKEIVISVVKSPTFVPLLATLVVTNQKWLFPQIPDAVVQAFLNFLALVLGGVSLYYTGKNVQRSEYKREALRLQPTSLPTQKKVSESE